MKTKTCIDPKAIPKFCKARAVPYALRKKVDLELECMEKVGIIESVEFSDWATPIVPIVKANESICICGDYKVTINQASKVDTYPLPRIEDLLSSLAGGKTFSKLDLAHAYQQIVLEAEAQQLVTIYTQKGLFKRLRFGVASALSIFQ